MNATTFAADNQPETVDASKCRFALGEVQFMQGEESDSIKHPIRMLARTDQPVNHWYWGRVVHDIEGIQFHGSSIVVDYCHDDREIMGYLDKFEASLGEGFFCEGALVRRPDSMADEVITNAENDVPYEASIFWNPESGMVVEQVNEGATAEVNGFQFEGPGVIIRQCVLHAVSVCPHGHDSGTETQFTNQTANQTVSLTYKEPATMEDGKKTTPEKTDGETQFSNEQVKALLDRVNELETKFAKESDEPQDLETALAQIADLKTKLAAQEKPADTTTDDDAGKSDENKFDLKAEFEAFEKKIEAKFKHGKSSDGNPVSGDGGEGDDKVKFHQVFKMRNGN